MAQLFEEQSREVSLVSRDACPVKAQLLAIVVATLLSTKLKTEESVAFYRLQAVLRQFSYSQSDFLITGNTTCLSALVEKKKLPG